MKAFELKGFEGLSNLQVAEAKKPKPGANKASIEVKAAGINFAEIEMTKGRYPAVKKFPFVMGFEAAGIVVEAGSQVKNVQVGGEITAIVSSGGYAEGPPRMLTSSFQFLTESPSLKQLRSLSTACRPTRF